MLLTTINKLIRNIESKILQFVNLQNFSLAHYILKYFDNSDFLSNLNLSEETKDERGQESIHAEEEKRMRAEEQNSDSDRPMTILNIEENSMLSSMIKVL